MSAAAREKFGKGYQTEAEKNGDFVLADKYIKYAKDSTGGAVPVFGYTGNWPLFGKPTERLGGADLIVVPDDEGRGISDATRSGKQDVPSNGVHYAVRPKWMCRSKTACIPCAEKDLFKPYCRPYGNHVVIECRRVELTKPPERKPKTAGNTGFIPTAKEKSAETVQPDGGVGAPGGGLAPGKGLAPGAGAGAKEVGAVDAAGVRRWDERGLARIADDIFLERDGLEARQEMFVGGHVYKGYQICGRERKKEAVDYAEFVVFNLVLALVAIYVLLQRQKFLAGRHQSMLARRIGRT